MEQESTIAETATAGQTVGRTLKAAREEHGLELNDIAQTTRVPLRHLVAIEADEHDSLPALAYTIGFIKTYARIVGLSPEALAAQYRRETSKVAHVPQMISSVEPVDESRVPPRWLVAVTLALVAAIVAGIWAWGAGWFETTDPAPVVAEATMPAPAPVAQPAPVAVAAAPVMAPAAPVTDPSVPPATDPAAATPAPGAPVPGGPVVISASDEVWFKVYDRATRQSVRMGILQPGESYTVPADRSDLLLWTGKAGALRLTVAGRALAPLGGPEEMVKDVSLVPADLLARTPSGN